MGGTGSLDPRSSFEQHGYIVLADGEDYSFLGPVELHTCWKMNQGYELHSHTTAFPYLADL